MEATQDSDGLRVHQVTIPPGACTPQGGGIHEENVCSVHGICGTL